MLCLNDFRKHVKLHFWILISECYRDVWKHFAILSLSLSLSRLILPMLASSLQRATTRAKYGGKSCWHVLEIQKTTKNHTASTFICFQNVKFKWIVLVNPKSLLGKFGNYILFILMYCLLVPVNVTPCWKCMKLTCFYKKQRPNNIF